MKASTYIYIFLFSLSLNSYATQLGNGIKIGEVTKDSAILWTRVTENADMNTKGDPFIKINHKDSHKPNQQQIPEGKALKEMIHSLTGTPGEVRFAYWPKGKEGKEKQESIKMTQWYTVDVDKDFTFQTKVTDLSPGTHYKVRCEARAGDSNNIETALNGGFRTAPDEKSTKPISFTVVTGQEFSRRDDKNNGHTIYKTMLSLNPNFFIHTGDIVYYDYQKFIPFANTQQLARYKWNRIFSLPFSRNFHNQIASYFIKDDHDTLKNDSWSGQTYGDLTWNQGLGIFREQVPMGEKTYRTIRWGKDLQIWLVEGRDFRSNNNSPDGPEKTILGQEQKQWLFETMKASDATFRVLVSATPVVGPDRGKKNDNHANAGFTHEGNKLREFIGSLKNAFIVCGDRHWQYNSKDPKTGVLEFCSGPTSDKHAGGFSEKSLTPMHSYLKIKGGFLNVTIERKNDIPQASLRHYSVKGEIYNKKTLIAK